MKIKSIGVIFILSQIVLLALRPIAFADPENQKAAIEVSSNADSNVMSNEEIELRELNKKAAAYYYNYSKLCRYGDAGRDLLLEQIPKYFYEKCGGNIQDRDLKEIGRDVGNLASGVASVIGAVAGCSIMFIASPVFEIAKCRHEKAQARMQDLHNLFQGKYGYDRSYQLKVKLQDEFTALLNQWEHVPFQN